MADLEFTGERFVTAYTSPQINYEHWHRYLLAAALAEGKTVLDIACGEGYGSHLMAQHAQSVVGIDIHHEAVAFAREKYQHEHLSFLVGSVESIPITTDHQFDLIVSFETIEHVTEALQLAFLQEIKRLLKPDGMLIMSTPNKKTYSDDPGYHNEFHIREFYPDEFKSFLGNGFSHVRLLGQRVVPISYIWESDSPDTGYREFKLQWEKDRLQPTQTPLTELYNLAFCSNREIQLPFVTSALVDISDQWSIHHQQQLNQMGQALYEKNLMIRQLTGQVREQAAALYRLENAERLAALPRNAVSIVIPVFNKVAFTEQCIDCLSRTTPSDLYNGVIVDNASTDATPTLLKQLSGDVTIVTNTSNQGFVTACNQGAEQSDRPYILFLNNDTEPQVGWLEELLLLMESDATIGAAGSKLIYPNNQLQEAGGLIFSDGHGWNFGRHDDPEKDEYNRVIEVDYCSGACLIVRRELFQKLQGFDKRYAPAYYEDVDLCFGIRALGYKVVYCPQSVVIHHEGATAGTDLKSGLKSFQMRNRELFLEKWRSILARHEANPNQSRKIPVTADRQKRGLAQPRETLSTDTAPGSHHLLVIDPLLPAYDRSAGSMRLFNILRIMRGFDWHVTYIARNGIRQEGYKRELESMGIRVYATDPDKMAVTGHPVTAERIMMETILTETHFDIAWLSFYEIAEQYLPEIRRYSPTTRILIDTVDVHFLRETRQAQLQNNAELHAKAASTKKRELAIYAQADALVMVTQADESVIHEYLPDQKTIIVPLIHETVSPTPGFEARQGLIFIANFNHPPNADAMLYFHRDVFPRIRKKLPDIRLTIAGANPPDSIKQLAGPWVQVTGYILETAPYLDAARVSIAPLRFGAGMKGKVCEALSRGLPVVTTAIGAEGIGLTHRENVMIADDPESFADAVVRLYTEEPLWTKLATQGRNFLEANYSYRAISAQLPQQLAPYFPTPALDKDLVSIIILTHNQRNTTQQCLESVFRHTTHPYELILVDNHSTDDTRDYIRGLAGPEPCRRIHLITNDENLGFAKGNNQGIELAQGNFLLLMNNDIVVTPFWLEKLMQTMQRRPDIGIVGPMTNHASSPQLVESPGYDLETLAGLDDFALDFSSRHAGEARSYWRLVGFCMLVDRRVIDKIGGLDGRFGLGNFEDDDFTLRASIAGYSSWIAEDCYVHHFGSRTFADAGIDYHASLRQNWEIFKRKWRIPAEVPYGYKYNMKNTIQKGFQQEHYCPLG